jgi:hypothetical protein
LSLLPDDDEPLSLLPPEEQNAPDPDMFIDDGSSPEFDSKKKTAIPKYKNLIPKRVFALPLGVVAILIDLLFAYFVYNTIIKFLHTNGFYLFDFKTWTTVNWLDLITGSFSEFVNLFLKIRSVTMGTIMLGTLALLFTSLWIKSEKSTSKCPVCKKKNYRNYHICTKCNYMFMSRDMIDREVLTIKLNNIDYTPDQVRHEFLERKLADMNPKHIKKVLVKNHFL